MNVIQILTLAAIAISAAAITAAFVSLNRLSRLLREAKVEVAMHQKFRQPSSTPPVPDPVLWIEVPVTLGFDVTQPIGELRMLRSFLPPSPDFVFSIGVSVQEYVPPFSLYGPDFLQSVSKFELRQVALLPDANYIEYLRMSGKLPKE